MTGILKLVHRAEDPDGPFVTIGEVAEYFERDRSTIKRWCRRLRDEGFDIPSHRMQLGDEENPKPNAFVWLYTEQDIDLLESLSNTINPKGGRPKKNENA